MRYRRTTVLIGLGLLALGCKGDLIDIENPGGNQTPPSAIPALALRIGGTGVDNLTDLRSDGAGNLYLAGTFSGAVDFDPGTAVTSLVSLGASDAFVAKYTAAGALVWVSRLGGTGTETAGTLALEPGGNLVVGGGFDGAADFDPGPVSQFLVSLGSEDGYIARLSSTGDLIWARRFGGADADRVEALAVDASGNVYAAGTFCGEANTLPAAGPTLVCLGGTDAFLLSFDPAGTVRWANPIGAGDFDTGTAVAVTSDGAIALAGSFRGTVDFAPGAPVATLTSVGGYDAYVASYSAAGALRWNAALAGTGNQEVSRGGIAAGRFGSVVVTGTFEGTVDLNPGAASSLRISLGATDWFSTQLDAAGAFEWGFAVGGTGSDKAPRPAIDADGTLLLVGSFTGPMDFDPGSGSRIINSLATAGSDAFVARYAAGGGLLWVARFGEATAAAERTTMAAAIAADLAGGLVVAGQFFGTPDFDPGAPAFRLLSLGDGDGFVVKLTAAGALTLAP